jgi:hypothetical protein
MARYAFATKEDLFLVIDLMQVMSTLSRDVDFTFFYAGLIACLSTCVPPFDRRAGT